MVSLALLVVVRLKLKLHRLKHDGILALLVVVRPKLKLHRLKHDGIFFASHHVVTILRSLRFKRS